MSPYLSYTNRQGSTAYIRAVPTAKGGARYYITKDPEAADLLEEMPSGFEFYEYPSDDRIVFRKRVPCKIRASEQQVVEEAMHNLSDVKDFIVAADANTITIYISQFSSISGEHENPTAEETRLSWGGEHVDRFKQYDEYVRFILVNEAKRTFRLERIVFLVFFNHDYAELETSDDLESLAEMVCQQIGYPTYFDLAPKGYEE
ncbi:hypothetical protein [Runella sp.]|uniref:hypothetical protein n=1 Tax=Runella sp. TaxID=1960881 RepID=UPI003D144D1F